MNFYKRDLGAYARDTAHLSLIEHGAYSALLDTYYATEKPLPGSKAELYRIAKAFTSTERKAVDKVAEQFFPLNGDGSRHNKRADEELHAYRAQAETNRRIAVEREAARKRERKEHEPCTNGQPNSEVRSKKYPQTPAPAAGFARFWEAWPKGPRKAEQGKCAELWQGRGYEGKADEIVRHVEAMKQSKDWRDGYVPAPIVYLRGRRWEGAELDEPERPFPT